MDTEGLRAAAPEPMARIALSAISFHKALFRARMTQSDVLAVAANLGFSSVELLDLLAVPLPFGRLTGFVRQGWHSLKSVLPFAPTNPRPIRPKQYDARTGSNLRQKADAAGVRVVAWTLDTDLAVTGTARDEAEPYWSRGIAAARALGATVLRVTSGGTPNASLLPVMRDNLQRLVEQAHGLTVAVENHGGLSNDPLLFAELLDGVTGCCLDLGNYHRSTRDAAIRILAPRAVHVHAKTVSFDARGYERTIDYPVYIALLKEAGYRGYYSIEYEGYGKPEEGIRQSADLLLKLI